MSLTRYELATFQDAIEQVLDAVVGGDADPRRRRNAARAVREALRDLANYRNWSCYYRRVMLATVAQQTDGTLAYDHTGGSSERLVTLSGATVDSSVELAELIIGNVRYEVEKYLSSTTFTLSERANPGADVAAGTSYTLVRPTYSLPDDFGAMGQLLDPQSAGRVLSEVTLEEALQIDRTVRTAGLPWAYAFARHPRYAGGRSLRFAPSPTTARTYDAIYRARPLPLLVELEDDGLVSITSGSPTVTCDTAGTFTQQHVGCVLRLSADNSNPPTTAAGNLQDVVNPYTFQGVVRSVESSTSLTLEQAADQTLGPVCYTLSSRLDLEAGAMLNALLKMAEARMASIEGRDDWAERKKEAVEALQVAAEADLTSFPGSANPPVPTRLGDLATSIDRSLN
jgi:hypothetical protein